MVVVTNEAMIEATDSNDQRVEDRSALHLKREIARTELPADSPMKTEVGLGHEQTTQRMVRENNSDKAMMAKLMVMTPDVVVVTAKRIARTEKKC